MIAGDEKKKKRARALTLSAVLIAGVGAWACSNSESSLPTEPAGEAQDTSAADANLPARMPIVLVHRHSSPSPTVTHSSVASPTRTPTRPTHTPTMTPTVTPTPTPSVTIIRLRAVSWQWDFVQGPNISSTAPYPGLNTITLKKGQPYELHIYNDAPAPSNPDIAAHSFSGIPLFGLSASGPLLYEHGNEAVRQFTPQNVGSASFFCGDTNCSNAGYVATEHDQMVGLIKVVP